MTDQIAVTEGIADGKHALITGPMKGPVVIDGQPIDVTPTHLSFDSLEDAQRVSHAIGLAWEERGHPDDVEVDDDEDSETFGQVVQRPFEYQILDTSYPVLTEEGDVGDPNEALTTDLRKHHSKVKRERTARAKQKGN